MLELKWLLLIGVSLYLGAEELQEIIADAFLSGAN